MLIEIHLSQIRISDSIRKEVCAVCPYLLFKIQVCKVVFYLVVLGNLNIAFIHNREFAFFTFERHSWRKWLGTCLPPLGSRVRISVSPCGFRGGRNRVWVGFSRGFSRFPLLISSISFHFIRPCDGASGVVSQHPCYSRTSNVGASSHLIPRPDLVLDTS